MSKDSRYARNTERGYKGAASGEILIFLNKNSYNTFIYLQNNIKTSTIRVLKEELVMVCSRPFWKREIEKVRLIFFKGNSLRSNQFMTRDTLTV